MLEQKKLTIVIVSYNEAEFISQCIESCINQKSLVNFEILIGDDDSSDNSIDIITNYSKKYPQLIDYFIMERNSKEPVIGAVRASNVIKKAFEKTSSKYCIVLSADDYLCDDFFLSNAIKILDSNDNYTAVVSKSFKKIWPDNTESIITQQGFKKALYWSEIYTHISCFVFRRDIAVRNLLPRFCDDTGLQYSIIVEGAWYYIDACPFCYRQRDKSIMAEADKLELSIIEVMLLQDVLNSVKQKQYRAVRFMRPLLYVLNHRAELLADKYKKYLLNCHNFENDIMSFIVEYDAKSFFLKLKIKIWIRYNLILLFFIRKLRKFINLYRRFHNDSTIFKLKRRNR